MIWGSDVYQSFRVLAWRRVQVVPTRTRKRRYDIDNQSILAISFRNCLAAQEQKLFNFFLIFFLVNFTRKNLINRTLNNPSEGCCANPDRLYWMLGLYF